MPKRVLIVGAGGVGSWLSEGVVRILEYSDPGSVLIIVDGDAFEPKNAERQLFKQMGNKAEVRAAELAPLFPRTYVIPRPQWVVDSIPDGETETETKILASALLEEGDVVFAVVDNFAARKLIFDAATKLDNIDIYTGGNDDSYFASTYHYQRRDGRDITDHPQVWHPEYENPPDRNPGALSCQERAEIEGGTQIIGTNMAVAAFLLMRVNQQFAGADVVPHSEFFFDGTVWLAASHDRDAADEPSMVPSTTSN